MNRLSRRQKVLALVLVLVVLGSALYAQSPFAGFTVVFVKNLIDLRAANQFRSVENNQPGSVPSPADLKVGDVFMTADDEARKVVSIYERNGNTVIETVVPRAEEVFVNVYVPDFEVEATRENVDMASLAPGVTLRPPGDSGSFSLSPAFAAPDGPDQSVTWLETDPETESMDIITFDVDIPLWSADVSGDVIDALTKTQEDATADSSGGEDEDGTTTEAGGKPSLDMGAAGEIRLLGTMRLAKPTISGGFQFPYISFSWVEVFWGIYLPVPRYHTGYAKAEFNAAQQFDFRITGTISLTAELKIPLYAVQVTYNSLLLTLGVYIKVGLEGQISVSLEVSEFTRHMVGASCDIHLPFIPVKFRAYQSNYLNVAMRPTIAAEAELKTGLYLGGEFEIAGITIVGVEGGGGAYILVEGYMEPLGIMGFDTIIGGYGNFDEWILDLYAEAGAYVEVGAEILSISIPIYDKRWPFWEWHRSWEI
jgi:hypothetical protein